MALKTLRLMLFLMNRVLPSHIVALTPPGWLLAGGAVVVGRGVGRVVDIDHALRGVADEQERVAALVERDVAVVGPLGFLERA